jgi:hypothetical protein
MAVLIIIVLHTKKGDVAILAISCQQRNWDLLYLAASRIRGFRYRTTSQTIRSITFDAADIAALS